MKKQMTCSCGTRKTTQPLKECRPCATCGRMLHTQYDLLYHPYCIPKVKVVEPTPEI